MTGVEIDGSCVDSIGVTQVQSDDEAGGGVQGANDINLSLLHQMSFLKSGVGICCTPEDFVVLSKPQFPNAVMHWQFHFSLAEESGLPAGVSEL